MSFILFIILYVSLIIVKGKMYGTSEKSTKNYLLLHTLAEAMGLTAMFDNNSYLFNFLTTTDEITRYQ